MGAQDKPGFLASKWTTIALIAVLVILVVLFIWIQATGGFGNFFERFKKKKEPTLKLPGAKIDQQRHNPGARPSLEPADGGFIILTETELS